MSQTLPQACSQGIEGPLRLSAFARPWTCLIPACFPSNLWPLVNGNYCPLPTLLDCDLFLVSIAQPTGLLLATMPLVWGAAPLAVPWCLEWHVWICPSDGFLEISLFCMSKHVQRIPKYCEVFRSLVWILKFLTQKCLHPIARRAVKRVFVCNNGRHGSRPLICLFIYLLNCLFI